MSRVLMTSKEHSEHDAEWLCPGSKADTLVCIACKFNILQDQEELSVKKRVSLSEFISVLSTNTKEVLEILISKCDFTKKFILMLLYNLVLYEDDDSITSLLIEAITKVLIQLNSNSLTCLIIDEVSQLLFHTNQSSEYGLWSLLGYLLQTIPELGKTLINSSDFFIENLIDRLDDSSIETKTILVFILLKLFVHDCFVEFLPDSISTKLPKSLVSALRNDDHEDLIFNSLVLLRHLSNYKECIQDLYDVAINEDEIALCSILKHLTIHRNVYVQICSVQCVLTHISGESETSELVKEKLLSTDLSEFLFEAMSTTNDVLLQSILSCLVLLSNHDTFFRQSIIIYGIGPLIRTADALVLNRQLDDLSLCFSILTNILNKGDVYLVHITQELKNILKTIRSTLSLGNINVFIKAVELYSSACKKEIFDAIFPADQILELNAIMVKELENNVKQNWDGSNSLEYLNAVLDVLIASTSLFVSCCDKVIFEKDTFAIAKAVDLQGCNTEEREMTLNSEAVSNFTIEVIVNIIYPIIKELNCTADVLVDVYDKLLVVVCFLYDLIPDNLQHLSIFCIKSGLLGALWNIRLLKTNDHLKRYNFIQNGNLFFKKLTSNMLKSGICTSEDAVDAIKNCYENLAVAIDDALELLNQPSDVGQNMDLQIFITSMVYFSEIHQASLVEFDKFTSTMQCFVVTNSKFLQKSVVMLKLTVFLYCMCFKESIKENPSRSYLSNVDEILAELLLKIKNFESVYTHHDCLLIWSSSNEQLSTIFYLMIEKWICHGTADAKNAYGEHRSHLSFLYELLFCKEHCLGIFLNIILDQDSEANEKAMCILDEFHPLSQSTTGLNVPSQQCYHFIKKYIHDEFQKAHLKGYENYTFSYSGMSSILKFVSEVHKMQVFDTDQDEIDIKLIFLISRFLVQPVRKLQAMLEMFGYIASFMEYEYKQGTYSAALLLFHQTGFMTFLNQCLLNFERHSAAIVEIILKIIASILQAVSKNEKVQQKTSLNIMNLLHIILSHKDMHVQASAIDLFTLITLALHSNEEMGELCNFGQLTDALRRPAIMHQLFIHLCNIITQDNILTLTKAVKCLDFLIKSLNKFNGHLATSLLELPWITTIMHVRLNKNTSSYRNDISLELLKIWLITNVYNPMFIKIVSMIQNKMKIELEGNCDNSLLDTLKSISSMVYESCYFKHLEENSQNFFKSVLSQHNDS